MADGAYERRQKREAELERFRRIIREAAEKKAVKERGENPPLSAIMAECSFPFDRIRQGAEGSWA